MDVGPALIADGEASEAVEPSENVFDPPPPVLAKRLSALDATTGNAWGDAPGAAFPAAAAMIISLVGVQLVWPAAGQPGPPI